MEQAMSQIARLSPIRIKNCAGRGVVHRVPHVGPPAGGFIPPLRPRPRASALDGATHTKRPPVVPASGLVDSTLGYPARGPASWRRRSEFPILAKVMVNKE